MTCKPKHILYLGAGLFFTAWLVWYLVHFLYIQNKTIRTAAASALNCPSEQIQIGSTQQFTDYGPTEVPVKGCGKSARIICTDYTSTKNIIAQYFSFEITCAEKK